VVTFLAHPVHVCGRCNSSTTDHEYQLQLVVPSTTHLPTATYEEPTYLSTVTCSGSLTHVSNSTCLTMATTAAAAADGADGVNGNEDDDDDDGESSATPPTVRRTMSSPPLTA